MNLPLLVLTPALAALALAVPAPAVAQASGPAVPCIPDGTTSDIEWTSDLTDPGVPVGATVVPGSITGHEHDDQSADDDMGSGSHSQAPAPNPSDPDIHTFTIPVENKGGNLSGPNGTTQNGFPEGDCIEVYASVTVKYQVSTTEAVTVEIGGVSTTTSITTTVWHTSVLNFRDAWRRVCPC